MCNSSVKSLVAEDEDAMCEERVIQRSRKPATNTRSHAAQQQEGTLAA